MLIELFLALSLGIIFGTFTGLTPGIHINLISGIIVSILTLLLTLTTPQILIIFIISMAITHTFIDFIPSILLGAPDEDTVLSILPGHELLKQGKGFQAIVLSTYGSIAAIGIILILIPLFLLIIPKIESLLTIITPYLLIASITFLISKEKEKTLALIVFFLSGFLGIAVLNSPLKDPFLPLFSGLFGASSLIISIKTNTKIPKQEITKPSISKKEFLRPLAASMISAPLTTFLPGLGSGQAAIMGSSLIKSTKKGFIVLLGATNTLVIGLSFVILYTLGKKRTGVAAAIELIVSELKINDLFIILTTITLVGIIAFFLTIKIAKIAVKNIQKVNYKKASYFTLIILSLIVLYFSGPLGFLIYLISTATGIYGILTGVKRINLMGSLVIPVTLWYLL